MDGTTGSDIDVEKDFKVSSGNSRNETNGRAMELLGIGRADLARSEIKADGANQDPAEPESIT